MGRRILLPFLLGLAALVGCEQDSPSEPATPTGDLALTVEGLPGGTDAVITVSGPGGYQVLVTESETLENLNTGSYTIDVSTVLGASATYTSFPAQYLRTVSENQTTSLTITYAESSADNNLWIAGMYLIQSVQDFDGNVPIVADRDGLLRVFVQATKVEAIDPTVTVEIYDDQDLIDTVQISAPGSSVSSSLDEGDIFSTWNVTIPAAQISPNLRILAEIDADNTFPETDETDNRFPSDGTPQDVDVWDLGELQMRFVPIHQSSNGLIGSIDADGIVEIMEPVDKMMPIAGYSADQRTTYTTSLPPLQDQDQNGSWGALLNELYTVRQAEETVYTRHWYGIVDVGYGAGVAGIAYVGGRTGLGRQLDNPVFEEILPHEVGHNLGRQHSACGTVGGHPDYPHPNGQIGAYGIDLETNTLYNPTTPDVMGYCSGVWISDYTFENAAIYRQSFGKASPVSKAPTNCLLVWGRIEDSKVVLEPAFEMMATPREPDQAGEHRLELTDVNGDVIYDASFTGYEVADLPNGSQTHFAFLIPTAESVESIAIRSPRGEAMRQRNVASSKAPSVSAQAASDGVAVQWSSQHEMVLVRDPDSGQILSMARGSSVNVKTTARDLDLLFSDGTQSQRQRLSIR